MERRLREEVSLANRRGRAEDISTSAGGERAGPMARSSTPSVVSSLSLDSIMMVAAVVGFSGTAR